MADISALLANAAQTNADFDLGKLNKSYWEGRDQYAKNDLRDAFQGGIPKTPDGQDDYASMAQTLFQKGAFEQGVLAAKLGLEQQNQRFGQGQAGRFATIEGGGGQPPNTGPPSMSRSAMTPDIAPRNQSGGQPPQAAAPRQQPTVMTILNAQGIPNDQLEAASGAVSRQLGVGATDPIDPNDPQIRNVLVPAIAQLKRGGIGQAVPDQQPAPMVPTPVQTQAIQPQGQPSPIAAPTNPPSEIQKKIAFYTAEMADPRTSKQAFELAQTRLKALQENLTPTTEEKNARASNQSVPQYQQSQSDMAAQQAGAAEEAKLGATRYQSIIESGAKARQEIPQLQMLQQQMNDKNFFSGVGEEKNLLYKRLKSAVGIDPDAAVPQEMLRKVVASNVLSSLGALKGMGQMRNAVINMAQTASAAPSNSVPANKLLVEIALRTRQSEAIIADKAQTYRENVGPLDAGFDKQVTNYYKQHPLFSAREIDNWHRVIGEEGPQAGQSAAQPKLEPGKTMFNGHLYKGGDPNVKANWELRS